MPSFEDLKRINQANSIINRSNLSIGLRPMYLQDDEEEILEPEDQTLEQENFYTEEVTIDEAFDNGLKGSLASFETSNSFMTAEEFYAEHPEIESAYERLEDEDEYQEDVYEKLSENNSRDKRNFFDAEELDAKPLFETSSNFIASSSAPSNFSFSKTVLYTATAVLATVFLIFTFKPVSTAPDSHKNFEETKLQKLTKEVHSKELRSLIITSGSFFNKREAELYRDALNEKLGVPLEVIEQGKTFSIQIGPAYANHDDALVVFDELSRYSVENLSIKVAS